MSPNLSKMCHRFLSDRKSYETGEVEKKKRQITFITLKELLNNSNGILRTFYNV